jgi:Uma2 family endonuclease
LEPGDHLGRAEFERRYEAMPGLKKAELIEGVVFVPSPVRVDHHGSPHAALIGWMTVYWAATPGIRVADNTTIRLDMDNEPQPDALMFVEPDRGGQARIDADGYIKGGPELVAEVAASSASIDLNSKLRVYRDNGVREYIVWRVLDGVIDWFVLRQGQYVALPADAGAYRSETFSGLWLNPDALTRFDLAAVLQGLQQGLASAEHAAFVARLRPPGAAAP